VKHAGDILLAWALVLGGLAAYSARVVQKGRALARRLPDEDKPWT
jgi:hypothetical protein